MPLTLDDFIKGKSIAVVDIETTGFSHQKDCIVEIGVCELDLNSGECSELFNKIIQENRFSDQHRSAWIFQNSDLRYQDVLDAQPLEVYKNKLQEILNIYPATAYNVRFDFDFLIDRGFVIKELPCPMVIATDILKIPLPKSPSSYKWPSVQEAWDYFFPDNKYTEKHRAYDDAVHEAQIVFEMYKRNKWKPVIENQILQK